jgi:hypothetical protein
LQLCGLPVIVTGNPHIPHEHVRKHPLGLLSDTPEIRQRFSNRFCPVLTGVSRRCGPVSGNTCFSNTQTSPHPVRRPCRVPCPRGPT